MTEEYNCPQCGRKLSGITGADGPVYRCAFCADSWNVSRLREIEASKQTAPESGLVSSPVAPAKQLSPTDAAEAIAEIRTVLGKLDEPTKKYVLNYIEKNMAVLRR